MKQLVSIIVLFFCVSFVNQNLPEISINDVAYVKINTAFHEHYSFDKISIETAIKRKFDIFKERRQDVGNNKVFVQPFICSNKECLISIEAENEPYYTLLLVINESTKNANCMMVGYNFLSDSETNTMEYKFLNDSTIRLQEYTEIGGEIDSLGNIETEESTGQNHLISISKNGKIAVIPE